MDEIAISLNFDSLGQAYNFAADFHDPSFFEIMDRFLDFSNRHQFRYSIYVIGKDLENERNCTAIKRWAGMGHEIGNHSFTHPQNLASLPDDELLFEIKHTHELIAGIIGEEPRGFIAPGWAYSRRIHKILFDLNYAYDTSVFPSWLVVPFYLKMAFNHIGDKRLAGILARRDILPSLVAPRRPFAYSPASDDARKLWVLPLPTTKKRTACWHTLGFMFGWKAHFKLLRRCLEDCDAFYYLMHPADLLSSSDLDPRYSAQILERAHISLAEKQDAFEQVLAIFKEFGKKIVTMRELAALVDERSVH